MKTFHQEGFQQTPRMTTMGHAIDLTPGFKPVDCKTYNLSPQEQEKLKEFMTKIFALVEYALSSSPMASPSFFVKKKRRIATPY